MATDVTVVNKGEVIQVGSPRDLYLNPRSIFLASFIGETNLLQGTILSMSNHGQEITATVTTPIGPIKAANLQGTFQVGDVVCLSIRPESIKIDIGKRELTGQINVLETKFLRTIYLGELEQLLLLLADGSILKVNLFNAPDYNISVNDTIKCFFSPNKVTLLHSSPAG